MKPSTKDKVLGLQAWAGTPVDGKFGPKSVHAAWEKAGKPRYKPEKVDLWADATIRPGWEAAAERNAEFIQANRDRYMAVSEKTGVPWWAIGVLHMMEASFSFSRHLHNGDSLQKRTVRWPRNRPTEGHGPFTWEESAIDALRYDKVDTHSIEDWEDRDKVLDILERYNGIGYRKLGVPTPYLWSGTDHYSKGKYVQDGIYDKNAVSKQVGIVPVLKKLNLFA